MNRKRNDFYAQVKFGRLLRAAASAITDGRYRRLASQRQRLRGSIGHSVFARPNDLSIQKG